MLTVTSFDYHSVYIEDIFTWKEGTHLFSLFVHQYSLYIRLTGRYKGVSSAYKGTNVLCLLIVWPRGSMWIEKRTGSRIEPWGTNKVSFVDEEINLQSSKEKCLSERGLNPSRPLMNIVLSEEDFKISSAEYSCKVKQDVMVQRPASAAKWRLFDMQWPNLKLLFQTVQTFDQLDLKHFFKTFYRKGNFEISWKLLWNWRIKAF